MEWALWDTWTAIAGTPIGRGVLTGIGTAMVADYAAFRSWKSYRDAFEYDWAVAVWRWFQGAVVGGMMAAGINWAT